METKQVNIDTFTVSATFLITQVLFSALPGTIILLKNRTPNYLLLTAWFSYLLLSEIYQVSIRKNYQKGSNNSFSLSLFKLLLSCGLIFFIASQTTPMYAVILLAYEYFQILQNSWRYAYVESIWFAITNALFKGVIFNLLIALELPFHINFTVLQPYILSFSLALLMSILLLISCVQPEKRKPLLLLFLLLYLSINGLVIYFFQQKMISFSQFICILIVHLISSIGMSLPTKFKNPISIIEIMAFCDILIFYLL